VAGLDDLLGQVVADFAAGDDENENRQASCADPIGEPVVGATSGIGS